MDEIGRLVTLLALTGGALTLLGAVVAWRLDEARRIRRSLAKVLGVEPQPMLTARGRGVGIGFDLGAEVLAVAWDRGAWCLVYRIDELMGVELIVDERVAARAVRGEPRRPLDHLAQPQDRVRLRFVFDDATHPDFDIDLWRPQDDGLPRRLSADAALQEANRWMARMEAVLRRPTTGRPRPQATLAPTIKRQIQTAPPPMPQLDDDLDEVEPSWSTDTDDAPRTVN